MKRWFAGMAMVGAAALLTACSDPAADPPQQVAEALPGLSVRDARLIMPAVAGNPGVVYFDLVNTSDRAYAVRSVAVEGAGRTELHATMNMGGRMEMGETGPQTVEPGATLAFAPGGLHVMVFDLEPTIAPGGTATMTLTVAGGRTAQFTVPVKDAGEDR